MTAVPPWTFPGSRTLAGWWRQLAPLRPRQLWVGHLLLHGVEVLACRKQTRRPDRFTRLVLDAIACRPGENLHGYESRLHLGPQLLAQVFHRLQAEGLVRSEPAGAWSLTALGRTAQTRGEYPQTTYERRVFHFVVGTEPGQPARFLHLHKAVTVPWPATADWQFDVACLAECLRQPPAWKRRHGFPLDVDGIVGLAADGTTSAGDCADPGPEVPEWQRVIVEQPEHLVAVLVLTAAEGGERLQGFPVRPDGWALDSTEPAFSVAEGWQETFPELAVEPSADQWRLAWRAWCQPRSLSPAETDACSLQCHGCQLRVTAPRKLIERLRTLRSDALKGEAWVLAGEGRLRAAAQIQLIETPSPAPSTPGNAGRS